MEFELCTPDLAQYFITFKVTTSPTRKQHSSDNSIFRCNHCPATFQHEKSRTIHALKKHDKVKLEMFQCSICDTKFGLKTDLKRHVDRVHGSKKNYACDICQLKFSHTGHVNRHKTNGNGFINDVTITSGYRWIVFIQPNRSFVPSYSNSCLIDTHRTVYLKVKEKS